MWIVIDSSNSAGRQQTDMTGIDLLLQLWGGSFYLANKIALALAAGRHVSRQRRLRVFGWCIYILGVPAWVIILSLKHDWIAAAIEAGGLPAMLLGLLNVSRKHRPHPLFATTAAWSTYVFILFGSAYSLYDYGGITALSQVLEIGVMIGFLLGSYQLARNRTSGWLFFLLMNASMGSLMLLQHKPILALQQAVSFCFVIYGFHSTRRSRAESKSL